jgi:hypothetical protein
MGARPAHMVEQADGSIRGQRAYNGRQAYKPQVMLSNNTIEYSVHGSSPRFKADSYGGISAYLRVLKSAAFGPREFESKFHKKTLKDANRRQSVALAVAQFR